MPGIVGKNNRDGYKSCCRYPIRPKSSVPANGQAIQVLFTSCSKVGGVIKVVVLSGSGAWLESICSR
ncbi:TPA: hypothetical protein ACNTR8_004574, partial [Escherichia coli]